MSSEETQIRYSFLKILGREPTSSEITVYENDLQTSSITVLEMETAIEQKKTGQMTYDNDYTMTLTAYSGNVFKDIDYSVGMVLGNGKLVGMTSKNLARLDKLLMAAEYVYDKNSSTNTIPLFNTTQIQIDSVDTVANDRISNLSQSINMYKGLYTVSYDQSYGAGNLAITVKTFMARNYPFVMVQRYSIVPTVNVSNLEINHLITNDSGLQHQQLRNGTIDVNGTVYNIVSGSAQVSNRNEYIGFGCFYKFRNQTDDQTFTTINGGGICNTGLNVYKFQNMGYNKFVIASMTATKTYTVDILTVFQSEDSIGKYKTLNSMEINIDEAIKSNLMNIFGRFTFDEIQTEHETKWKELYTTSDITVQPKSDITTPGDAVEQAEYDSVMNIRRLLKTSQYLIYSIVNSTVYDEFYSSVNYLVDIDGTLYDTGDLWVIPCLTVLQTRLVENVLNFRYKQFQDLKNYSTTYGRQGIQFPVNNLMTNTQILEYDGSGMKYLYNIGLMAVSAWNYYRVNKSADWLLSKGSGIILGAADFFISVLNYDSENDVYNLSQSVGLNNTEAVNNSVVMYFIYLTIKYALQCSYEMKFLYSSKYLIYTKIRIPIVPNTAIIYTEEGHLHTQNDYTKQQYMEQFLPLNSYYNDDLIQKYTGSVTKIDILSNNLVTHQTSGTGGTNAIQSSQSYYKANLLLRSDVTVGYTQELSSISERNTQIKNSWSDICSMVNQTKTNPWRLFSIENNYYGVVAPSIQLHGQFLLLWLSAFSGMQIRGQVTQNRVYSEFFRLQRKYTNIQPPIFQSIDLKVNGNNYVIMNQLVYERGVDTCEET